MVVKAYSICMTTTAGFASEVYIVIYDAEWSWLEINSLKPIALKWLADQLVSWSRANKSSSNVVMI